DRDVGGRKLFGVAPLAPDPFDFEPVALLGKLAAAALANRRERIVVDLAALDRRYEFIEQQDQRPDDPRLGLPALAEEHHMMAGEYAVFDLRHHRTVVADDPRQDALLVFQPR